MPRRSHLGKLPLVGRLRASLPAVPLSTAGPAPVWVLTGLGSRGLIHHAHLAEALAKAVLADDEGPLAHLPSVVRL